MNYSLSNYHLTKKEIIQSCFASEYAFRHLSEAKKHPQYKWGHRLIAMIEFCPILGQITTLIESIIAKQKRKTKSSTQINFSISKPIQPAGVNQNVIPKISSQATTEPSTQINLSLLPQPPQPAVVLTRNVFIPKTPSKATQVFFGTQTGCNGKVTIDKVKQIFQKLLERKETGVTFNKNNIADSIEGGTCSAMSLEFIDSYFKAKGIAKLSQASDPALYAGCIRSIGKQYRVSSEEMRNRQAAFNTIEEDKQTNSLDFKRAKIQSLANFHQFKIDFASDEIDLLTPAADQEIKKMDNLPLGVYLLRILQPADNEKKEEKGHSLVYIKEKSVGFFYDPNLGTQQLVEGNHTSTLNEEMKFSLQQFQINLARFYRLIPEPQAEA